MLLFKPTIHAGWAIGRNITNMNNLYSYGGFIDCFKVCDRKLTPAEALAAA